MSKLAVKYNNDLNSIPLRNFNSTELDLFMTICANIKEKGTDIVTFDFDKLRELSKYEPTSLKRFSDDLDRTYKKLIELNIRIDYENGSFERFTLFNRYKVDMDTKSLEIQVNENFKYILNDLNLGNFTRFELKEYTSINSTYSKALYMRLKQWKSTGKWEVSLEEFKRVLAVPESYQMTNIDKRILEPALKDLKPFFKGLKVFKLDNKGKLSGRGRPVKMIRFTFQQQDDSKPSISSNKRVYGKHNNVFLTDKEVNYIVKEMSAKYLIEEVSEWKLKNPNEHNNKDFDLIKTFYKNKETFKDIEY